jgi:hypothetical protein
MVVNVPGESPLDPVVPPNDSSLPDLENVTSGKFVVDAFSADIDIVQAVLDCPYSLDAAESFASHRSRNVTMAGFPLSVYGVR